MLKLFQVDKMFENAQSLSFRPQWGVLGTVLMAAGGFALSCVAFYPGFMSFDSALSFWLARHGEGFSSVPQSMVLIWRTLLSINPHNGGALFVLNNALFWSALSIFSYYAFQTWYARALVFLICGVLSPCTMILAHLWSDALLIGVLSLACALLFLAVWKENSWGTWAALPLLIIAGLTRFNAFPALLPLFVLWSWLVFKPMLIGFRTIPRYGFMLGFAVALMAATWGINLALEKRFVTYQMSAWAVVALWDLAAISIATNEMEVPAFARPAETTIDHLRSSFRADANVPSFAHIYDNGNPSPYTRTQLRQINQALLSAISKHPRAYLEHRWRLTKFLFGRYRYENSLAFWPGVTHYGDNPPIALNGSLLQQMAIAGYEKAIRGWAYAPVSYVALSLLLLIGYWPKRHSRLGLFGLTLLTSGLLYVLPLPLVAPSAELRYGSWLFFSTLMAAALLFSCRNRAKQEGTVISHAA